VHVRGRAAVSRSTLWREPVFFLRATPPHHLALLYAVDHTELPSGPVSADYDKLFVLFRKVDKSGDGKVSKAELSEATRVDQTLTSQQAHHLMKFTETDDDGQKVVTFPAFYLALMEKPLDEKVSPSLIVTFIKMDADADGYITKDDVKKAIAEKKIRLSKKNQDKLFKFSDSDGDGKISLSEYVSAYSAEIALKLKPEEEAALRKQFRLLDANGDGWVSKAELKKAEDIMNHKGFAKIIALADKDGDGTISFEEFVAIMR
jgi:Ca2+-binding EF-hand superfamily protein